MAQRSGKTLVPVISVAMMLSLPASANAQDALGSGNALDRNSQVGSGGRNAGRPANPYAGRNSIVTGEVIGGREFRGRVGYTAPGDFRGSLGSNDLYRFRADSAWSGASGVRLSSGTYDQLRFGQSMGVLELSRSGSGATLSTVLQSPGPVSFSQIAESRLRLDNQLLTATSASRVDSSVQPLTLGTGTTADGREVAITASSVRGLTLDQFNQRWDNLGLSVYDQMRLREDNARTRGIPGATEARESSEPGARTTPQSALTGDRIGQQFETRFDELRTESKTATDARIDVSGQTDYSRLLQNIADRYANSADRNVAVDPAILKTLQEQYSSVKSQLSGQPATSDAAPRQATDPTSGQPAPTQAPSIQAPTSSQTPGRPDPNDPADPQNRSNQQRANQAEPDIKPVDPLQLGPALRHGEKIEKLSSEQQGRFNELMVVGETQLRAGDYMLAEQRFQRALRFSPGNPLAMAGAANAQLGAGLYLPAGYTLRSLFTQNPEMIDATYGRDLFPPADRIAAAVDALNTRIDAGTERAALALVLAYIGRQTSDRALMEQGIKLMSDESPSDPLPALLRTVWLEGGAAPSGAPEK